VTSQPSIPLRHSASPRAVTSGARSVSPPVRSGHFPPPSRGRKKDTSCLELAGGPSDPRPFIPEILSSQLKISNYSVDDVAKHCERSDVIPVHH